MLETRICAIVCAPKTCTILETHICTLASAPGNQHNAGHSHLHTCNCTGEPAPSWKLTSAPLHVHRGNLHHLTRHLGISHLHNCMCTGEPAPYWKLTYAPLLVHRGTSTMLDTALSVETPRSPRVKINARPLAAPETKGAARGARHDSRFLLLGLGSARQPAAPEIKAAATEGQSCHAGPSLPAVGMTGGCSCERHETNARLLAAEQ